MPFALKLREYAELVKFEHTIFALPFALSAMLLAQLQWPTLATVLWIVLAMVGGRAYAMGLNRILDAKFDLANPRTASRGIPAGRVSVREATSLTVVALVLLLIATAQLPPLCLQLLPVAVALLSVYSLMKRFSSSAHLVLGLCLGSSAIGGWLAVTGVWSNLAVLFGLAVALWVMGFDLIYACQDVEFDRSAGLHSVPAEVGIPLTLGLSKTSHGLAVLCLGLFGFYHPFIAWPYWLAVCLMAGFLVYEHRLVKADDLSRLDQAFFSVNGWISILVFACVLLNHWLLFVS